MNPNADTTVNNLHTIVVLVATLATALGLSISTDQLNDIAKGVVAIIGVISVISSWIISHRHHAATQSPVGRGSAEPSKLPSAAAIVTMLLLGLFLIFSAAGCTNFVTACGANKVITTITQRTFGVNISTASANNETPSIQLGLVTTTVQFLPLGTNGNSLQAPNYAATFNLENNASPFTFDGNESMSSGNYATFEPGQTNAASTATPVIPK
jgi:hypothetical protein